MVTIKTFLNKRFNFTFLRHPLNRTISQHSHMMKYPTDKGWFQKLLNSDTEPLINILKDDNRAFLLGNVMVKYLASDFNPLKNKGLNQFSFDDHPLFYYSQQKQKSSFLTKAINNLFKLDFFGITEYYYESMYMLADKLKTEPPEKEYRLQTSTIESNFQNLDNESISLLEKINNQDCVLYDTAKKEIEVKMIKFINNKLNLNLNLNEYIIKRKQYLNNLKNKINKKMSYVTG